MSEQAIAIVLARAGSKGLPRKNVLPVGGRPCIEWTIEFAADSRSVGPVLISSDDRDILQIAERWGKSTKGRVQAVERPEELAGDSVTVDAAARDCLARSGLGGGARCPVVLLYGNVPVRPKGLVDQAIEKLAAADADSAQSYCPVGKYHPWWMARLAPGTGAVRPWEGEVLNHGVFRRQDLPPVYVPDGGVLVVVRESLELRIPGVVVGPHAFFGREDRRVGVVTGEGEVVDIDSRADMLVADAILRERQGAVE